MSDQFRLIWKSGQLVSTPLTGFLTVGPTTSKDPSIPNLPLETAAPGGISGTMAATDPADQFAATGSVTNAGILATTDTLDTFAASGSVINAGTLAIADQPDVFSATGSVGSSAITGDMAAIDAADTFASTGTVAVQGTMVVTDPADTFSAAGAVVITGQMAAVDALDLFNSDGAIIVSGQMAAFDDPDIFSADGTVRSALLGGGSEPEYYEEPEVPKAHRHIFRPVGKGLQRTDDKRVELTPDVLFPKPSTPAQRDDITPAIPGAADQLVREADEFAKRKVAAMEGEANRYRLLAEINGLAAKRKLLEAKAESEKQKRMMAVLLLLDSM